MHQFTFFDTESYWDEHLHEDYRRIDPAAQPHHRIASRRIFAAAAFDVTIQDCGQISCDQMASWTRHDHGDEEAVVRGLFEHMSSSPGRTACGFGSVAVDLPLLTLAAMEYGLQLPAQLRFHGQSGPRNRAHIDLGLALKAQGATWSHLTEVILRLGLSHELIVGKARVSLPSSAEAWVAARAHCEMDTALLAIAMVAWLRAQGTPGLDVKIASLAVLEWMRRTRPTTDGIRERLAHASAQLTGQISERFTVAA